MRLLLLIGFCLLAVVFGRKGFGNSEQEWGHIRVRDGAHMFWWLHYTTASPAHTDRPLIIWLNGGPGRPGSLFGNFELLGPLDRNQNSRNHTWLNHANILFVDHHVGFGFSYVENGQFAKTDKQTANDFVELMRSFLRQHSQFERVPLYIFSQSYAGKMTVDIALQLYQANQTGTIKNNIKGVGLGSAWLSPIDSILNWAPYLYNLGVLDTQQYDILDKQAQDQKQLVETGRWIEAFEKYLELVEWIQTETSSSIATFFNVLAKNGPGAEFNVDMKESNQRFMNELVKPALNLTQNWTSPNTDIIFTNIKEDFMKPARNIVERLLDETDVTVAVYNGQLDLFVPTLSTLDWVDKLNFKGSTNWTTATRQAFVVDGVNEGFEKKAANLAYYWVLRAGHEVPRDNPNAMLYILRQVTNNFRV